MQNEHMPRFADTGNGAAAVPVPLPVARRVECEYRTRLPAGKVASLLTALENGLSSGAGGSIVHFTSPYGGEGTGTIAFETACAAVAANRRVLLVECGTPSTSAAAALRAQTGATLLSWLAHGMDEGLHSTPFAVAAGTMLHYAVLSADPAAGMPDGNSMKRLFGRLRAQFDLVIVQSESAITGGAAAAVSAPADGTVIVLAAESTRAPVARECRAIIEAGGGRVLGAVLNRRRHYIPRWLYALLFRPGKA